MSRRPDRSQQWFEVQRHIGQVQVARQSGNWPCLQTGQVLMKMLACGICGADIRAVTGNKLTSGNPDRYIMLGHEGVGVVIAVDNDVTGLKPDDYVVVLSHVDGIQPDVGNETIYVVRDVLTARVLAAENVTSSEPAVIKSLLAPVRHKRDHYLQALELRWVQTTSGT